MNAKENWKPVTISGVTGILMGAGTMYATQHAMNTEDLATDTSAQLKEVTATNDNLSFKHAFEAARAEVGPGGVFHWRGNIYNTYTAEEWNAMSANEKNLFAEQVKPEVSPADIDTAQLEVKEQSDADVSIVKDDNDVADDDVRIIGFGDVELANGRSVTVQELEINGNRVAVIDVDKDGVGDIAMCDANHNHQADDGEIIDLHTGEALTFNHQTSADDADFDLSMLNI